MSDEASRPASLGPRPESGARRAFVFLVALASVAVTLRLGVWQLDRAAQKEARQAQIDARSAEPVLAAAALAPTAELAQAQAGRRVRLAGHWVAARTVYLDNRQMDDRVGFFVVTPLVLDDFGRTVLVQRGWIARNFDLRTALPAIDTPSGHVDVDGTVIATPPRLFEFAHEASGPIRQNVDPASFAQESGLALLPLAVLESAVPANSRDGLARHWAPVASGAQMNYGYAFQWFAIGAVIAFLYVWLRIVRPRQRRRS